MKTSKTISAKQTQADLPFMDSFQDMSSLEDSVYFERDGFAETINDIKAEILSNQDRFKISEYDLGLGELKSIYVTNNQKYAIIGTTRDIAIFDIYNKQLAYILKDAHTSDITSLTSTSDDIFLISASSDKSIKVWNLKNRELLGSIQQAQDSKTVSIALTDDERHIIASAGADIAIWSFKEQKLIHTIKDAHEQEITTIKYMTNKNQILSIAADKSINIWKFETWELVHSFEQAHTSLIIGISLIKNETLAITASQDGSISLWDLEKFEHMCALASGNRKNIEAITLSGDDKFIIYATEDGALNVWDLETKTHLHSLKSQSPSRMCGLTNTKKYLVYINQDGFLYTLSLTGQKKTHVLEDARLTNITDLKISSDDSYVVVTSLDGYMQVWNLHLKECQQTFEKESKKGFRTCAISPDSKFIVSGSKDGTIDLWSLTAKQHIHSFDRFHRGEVLCAVFTQDGSKLISSCAGGIICVWNLQTNELIYRIEDAHKSWISSVVVTNDSKYLISGSHDKSIKIWDFETRVCVHSMVNAHKGTIRAVKLTRNGKMLITAGDEIIKLWDMQTRRLIQQFSNNQQRKGKIHSLAVSEDDQLLIAGDDEHNFTVYSLATKMLMHSFPKNSQLSKYVAITSDNKWIAYSNHKSIKVMENPLTGLSISVSNTLSPFSPFRFLPVIAFLTENDLENRQNLIQSYKNLQIFPYSWNWLHISSIFCPKKEIILACFESGVSFEIDLFGKTPLHYLLNNESKDFTCINYVIGKLPNILANHPRPMDLLSSMSDIVYKILEVHSPQVVQFLRMCVREPEAADVSALEPFGQIPKDLDICYHLSNSRVFSSEIHDKLGIKEGKRKLLIQILPFCWDYSRLSQDMHQLVKSLLLIDNQEIFETEAVGLLINYLWGLNKGFFWILGILFSINTVFISLYAGADDTFQGLEIIIIIFGLFFLFYEIFELCSSGWKTYLSHFWNYIDMFGTILLPSTLIAKRMGLSEDIKIYMFSFNIAYAYCRWLSYFRVFQQTRKLLQIIIEICKDIRSFLVLLGFITMGFALIFQQLDSNHDLTYHLMEAYDILFSDFDATGYSIAQIIYFLIVTIAAPIVLLNMLIAMMSETYTVAQDKFVLTDSIELLQLIDESMSIKRAMKSLKASFFPNKVKVEGNDMTNEHNSLHRVQTKKQYMFFVEEEIEVAEESENANPVAKPANEVKPSEVKPSKRDEQIDERLRGIEKMLADMQLSPRLKSPQEKHHLLDPNFRLDEVERKVSELSKVSKNIDAKFDLLLSLMKKEK